MCRSRFATSIILALGLFLMPAGLSLAEETRYGLGQPATEAAIKAWDIDVAPNGVGLSDGRGTVQRGAALYAVTCMIGRELWTEVNTRLTEVTVLSRNLRPARSPLKSSTTMAAKC